MKVYGATISPMVRKVLMALEIKGLDYQVEFVIPFNTPEGFEKISPLKKIPALVDGDVSLADSTVICEYLEDRYPETPLYPSDPVLKAKARWFEEYADTVLMKVTAEGLYFERVVKKLMGMETDEEKVQKNLKKNMPKTLDYMESVSPAEGFLVGDSLMMADIAIGSSFINAGYAGFEPDSSKYPNFAAYMQRIKAHPAFQVRMKEDAKFINKE
ncbi:glutathione S-transferase family protein [Endozoicomonas arenosclerae]|uniref:glutathione S-transferase family protein n=1 Tax=Endozoicomonas arenosclerae TaxID=1633495 RepID=UPI00078248E1|nr:glutathione S-transferase family protein [Endozoicomonas arenosclerae]